MRSINPFRSIIAERAAIQSQYHIRARSRSSVPVLIDGEMGAAASSTSSLEVPGQSIHNSNHQLPTVSTSQSNITKRQQQDILPSTPERSSRTTRPSPHSYQSIEQRSKERNTSTTSPEEIESAESGEKRQIRCGYPYYEECIASAKTQNKGAGGKRRPSESGSKRGRLRQVLRMR